MFHLGKVKESVKKPAYPMAGNVVWSVKMLVRNSPAAFFILIVQIPVNIGLQYLGIYLPSLAVSEVTSGHGPRHAVSAVGVVMLTMMVGDMLKKALVNIKASKLGVHRYKTAELLTQKSLGMFYQTYEKKDVRDLGSRALIATQMWNGVQPLVDILENGFGMAENLLGYLLFGTVISFASPWLVLFLTLAPIVNLVSVRIYQKWEYSHRGKMSDMARKLDYVRVLPGDFSGAKDIRIYSMASWLRESYRDVSSECAKWDKKMVRYRFLSRIADLLVILVRDGGAYALLIGMVLDGRITVDRFILYFAAVSSFAGWVGGMVDCWNRIHACSLQICDFREYIDYPDGGYIGHPKQGGKYAGCPGQDSGYTGCPEQGGGNVGYPKQESTHIDGLESGYTGYPKHGGGNADCLKQESGYTGYPKHGGGNADCLKQESEYTGRPEQGDKYTDYPKQASEYTDYSKQGDKHTDYLKQESGYNDYLGQDSKHTDCPEQSGSGSSVENPRDYLFSAPQIEFDQVCFRYDGAKEDTVHNLSFTLHKGEKLALVGANGAGKTTIVKLLCGLYVPSSGEIRMNGTPLSEFRRKDYYKLISPVFQDIRTAFFSLAETVSGKGLSETDIPRAEECLRRAGLGGKLDALPEGVYTKLDKQVNRDGTELSGGEAQKLMLARALYKDAPLLVLDEPTAALDTIAESRVYEEYGRMAQGKTSLFISHRLASTSFCDRIILVENGAICEEGSHRELMRQGGEYKKLFAIQSCWYQEDGEGVLEGEA